MFEQPFAALLEQVAEPSAALGPAVVPCLFAVTALPARVAEQPRLAGLAASPSAAAQKEPA